MTQVDNIIMVISIIKEDGVGIQILQFHLPKKNMKLSMLIMLRSQILDISRICMFMRMKINLKLRLKKLPL